MTDSLIHDKVMGSDHCPIELKLRSGDPDLNLSQQVSKEPVDPVANLSDELSKGLQLESESESPKRRSKTVKPRLSNTF